MQSVYFRAIIIKLNTSQTQFENIFKRKSYDIQQPIATIKIQFASNRR